MEAAVVSASHGALGSLLGKLGDLLTAKYKLLKETKGQIVFLKSELESMYVFLKKISDTEEPDEQDRCWAKEVRELSYDIEDSVSEFMLRVERDCTKPSGFKGFISRSSKLLTTMNIRHEIAKEFEGLRTRVKEVSERRTRYKMDHTVPMANKTTVDHRLLALHAETASLVGVKGPRDQLIQLMDEEGVPTNQLKVLSILGFGGLGKTTLANEIYRKLKEKFHCQAFVSVSQKLNINKIMRKIISQVGYVAPENTNIEIWEESELITSVKKFLLDKRYLIVIDDIWDASAWHIIRCALPENKNGSRVITTTRIEAVARACCTNNIECIYEMKALSDLDLRRYLIVIDDIWDSSGWDVISCALPENKNGSRVITTTRIEAVARACCGNHIERVYQMKALSDQHSRRLFFKRIFGSEDTCPAHLNEVSAEILKKCGGLPLAIITISSMLANQRNNLKKEQWEYVLNSLGSTFEMSPTLEGMRQILNLSYINLPHCLKACMLYLGIYPEDHTISRNDLTRQWIAEGFICRAGGIDAENIANNYFNKLINRSMIQPTDIDYNGEVISCRVHDMMLDLLLHKCVDENFVIVIDDIQDMTRHQGKIRRLCLNLDGAVNNTVGRSIQLSQTRTLAIYGTSLQLLPFKLFKHLRVLVLEILRLPQPEQLLDFTRICHLFQLRFLKIVARYCRLVLPSKIGDLHQLEVFEIDAEISSSKGTRFHKLPSDVVTLSRLFRLIVPRDVILPEGIGNMKSLCTLRGFDLDNSLGNIKGLRELTNLTKLEISIWSPYKSRSEAAERCKEVVHALENLCNIKYLHFVSQNLDVRTCLDKWCSVPACFVYLQSFHAKYAPLFSRVPKWICQLHSIYDLILAVEEVLEDDLGLLAQLPSLIHLSLHIYYGAPTDKIPIHGGRGFPVLKHFRLVCSRPSYMTFEAGAMPKLERLELCFNAQGWDRYGAAPTGIENLSGLKEICVNIGCYCAKESNKRAAESALRDVADMHQGRPVANINFNNGLYAFDGMLDEPDETKDEMAGDKGAYHDEDQEPIPPASI